jgi:hypothetical protein
MRHFSNLRQQTVSKRQHDHVLPLSLQKLCCVGAAFISNTDSPAKQSNKSSSQTRAPTKAPDVALATRRPYFSISAETDKLWARSDSASEVRSVVDEASYSPKQFWPRSTLSSFKRPKKPFKNPSRNKDSQSRVSSTKAAFHTALARSSCHVPQPNPTRCQHAHNPQPTKEVSFSHPQRLPLRLPRPSRFFPSLAVFIDPQPPQEQETFAQLEAPYRVHILDNATTFHKYPSDTH